MKERKNTILEVSGLSIGMIGAIGILLPFMGLLWPSSLPLIIAIIGLVLGIIAYKCPPLTIGRQILITLATLFALFIIYKINL